MNSPPAVGDLLDRADAERLAGRGESAARLYQDGIDRCRRDGDLAMWTRAALGAASVYVFGAEPGRLPAQLYDVLVRTTDDGDRARVAAALARCWVYAGHGARAVQFADEAVQRAEAFGEPELLADCLDAALAARWGPDEVTERAHLAARLDEVAAHVLDPQSRLQAHLWSLHSACESLDLPAMHRHLRGLELLGEESPRAQLFAASRRLMLDLLKGRTDTIDELVAAAAEACQQAELADGWLVVAAMKGYSAAQSGDSSTCATSAAGAEAFGLAEGSAVVTAEAAFLWLCAGQPARARALLNAFSGGVLDDLPRDVNWLLIMQCVLEVALAVGDRDIVETAARLLGPYSGRAVFNAGAVMFHGVTDDTLSRAAALLDDPQTATRLRTAALSRYEHLGATWWYGRLAASTPDSTSVTTTADAARLHPTSDGLWLVGPHDKAIPVRALRGFGYLRELLRRPGSETAALDLVAGNQGTVVQAALGGTLDKQAIDTYRRRLAEIDHELEEAGEWSDLGRVDVAQAERDALLHELGAAAGLGGRTRSYGSNHERARIAATKAIRAAIDRISSVDPAVGEHLDQTIRTGLFCSYAPGPDDERRWILDG